MPRVSRFLVSVFARSFLELAAGIAKAPLTNKDRVCRKIHASPELIPPILCDFIERKCQVCKNLNFILDSSKKYESFNKFRKF